MKVSICCLTYNHGSLLEEAIRSFLVQETAFDVEIVIGDDASTDSTAELVNEYAKKYTQIKYHRHKVNIGMMPNAVYTLKQCTGEYIALCEGDDFWIDPLKLQKQVSFLETNTNYSLCATGSITRNETNNQEELHVAPGTFDIEELLKQNRFRTATILFAGKYLQPIPQWFEELPFGDWATYLTVLYHSGKKAYSLPDVTAVRRLHTGGAYSSMYSSTEKMITTLRWDIEFYRKMQSNLFKKDHQLTIDTYIKEKENIIVSLECENSGNDLLGNIVSCVPEKGSFILIDDFCLNTAGEVAGKKVVPFIEKNGVFWGRPANDGEAIAEIGRQQKKGVNIIAFTWQAFWWLEHYSEMLIYLKTKYSCIVKNDCLMVFDLQKLTLTEQESHKETNVYA